MPLQLEMFSIPDLFLVSFGLLLALLGGSFVSRAGRSEEAIRDFSPSRTRTLGLVICLSSFFVCAFGITALFQLSAGGGMQHTALLPLLGSLIISLSGIYLGGRLIRAERSANYITIATIGAGILWWVTRDGQLLAEEYLVLFGFAVWLLVFLLSRYSSGRERSPSTQH